MSLKHVVIGGGTGYIGSCINTALTNNAVKTTVISRMRGPGRMSWHDLEKEGLPKDTTHVINVAGQNILSLTNRWNAGFKQNVWNSRVNTTSALAKAIQQADVKSFVTISGVAYYPPDGKDYTEDSKCEAYDFLSEMCHHWENAAKLPSSSKTKQVVIRSGVVLGRTGGMVQQIYIPFWLGLGGPLGSGTQPLPWIHIHDLVDMFTFALLQDNVKGILNGVAPELVTNAEFTKTFAKVLSRPAFLRVPALPLNYILHEERAKIMLTGQRVIPKRVLELGFSYKYPTIKSACEQFSQTTKSLKPY